MLQNHVINLSRRKIDQPFGMRIAGGKQNRVGLYIIQVLTGMPAHSAGLQEMDEIREINGLTVAGLTQRQFVEILQPHLSARLMVRRRRRRQTLTIIAAQKMKMTSSEHQRRQIIPIINIPDQPTISAPKPSIFPEKKPSIVPDKKPIGECPSTARIWSNRSAPIPISDWLHDRIALAHLHDREFDSAPFPSPPPPGNVYRDYKHY